MPKNLTSEKDTHQEGGDTTIFFQLFLFHSTENLRGGSLSAFESIIFQPAELYDYGKIKISENSGGYIVISILLF